MKNHILGSYAILYYVENIPKAKAWYTTFLGVQPYIEDECYVGFNLAGYELGLHSAAQTQRKSVGCVAYWGVTKIAESVTALEAKGHKLFDPITNVGGGIKVASLLDQDGNIIGLIENPHFQKSFNQ